MSRLLRLVEHPDEVVANIDFFEAELERESHASSQLRARLRQFHAFYATKSAEGSWKFAPSKFVGYQNNSAEKYMSNAGKDWEESRKGGADGRETERQLAKWFVEVDRRSKLGRELFEELGVFLGRFGGGPRKDVRLNVLKSELEGQTIAFQTAAGALLERISVDSRVCGGRPCIAGTRIRVSDILSMLAANATEKEILADYPYLSHTDIAAALAYGARAADHRVIRAA